MYEQDEQCQWRSAKVPMLSIFLRNPLTEDVPTEWKQHTFTNWSTIESHHKSCDNSSCGRSISPSQRTSSRACQHFDALTVRSGAAAPLIRVCCIGHTNVPSQFEPGPAVPSNGLCPPAASMRSIVLGPRPLCHVCSNASGLYPGAEPSRPFRPTFSLPPLHIPAVLLWMCAYQPLCPVVMCGGASLYVVH